ncbi:MAG: hypothetical protein RLZZ67_280 [Candidatus Parcubacteria bacterium]|jgi:hypothetical protein
MKDVLRKITTGFLFAGFITLSVFGIGSFLNVNGESILSCVAKSAGIVSCEAGSNSLSGIAHEGSAFDALLAVIISTFIVVAISLAIIYIFTLKDVVRDFIIPAERLVVLNVSLSRLKSWISLFELSPGN